MVGQAARAVVFIDSRVDTNVGINLFFHRIFQDVSGVFVPRAVEKKQNRLLEFVKSERTKRVGLLSLDKSDLKDICSGVGCESFVLKNMTFTGVGVRGGDSMLTFVTSNPLMIYDEPELRCVRVAYVFSFPGDKGHIGGGVSLRRYESDRVDYREFIKRYEEGKLKGIEVLSNILDFKISAFMADGSNQKDKVADGFDTFSDFDQVKLERFRLPVSLRFSGTVGFKDGVSRGFEFDCPINVVYDCFKLRDVEDDRQVHAGSANLKRT